MEKTLTDWLYHFEKLHPASIDMGLTRIAKVWEKILFQQHIDKLAKKKVITVAGTNGKGSACKMLTLLLSAQGYRVGTYTSPHIHHFSERVQVNGVEVDDDLLARAFAAIEVAREDISLSYFEATTLVGLLVFAWEKVDFAVLEVGLGGRLDAINIIDADAVLITSIGLDHEAFLGNNLSKIALDKAGVCRPNTPCVYAEMGIYPSILQFADDNQISLLANARDYVIQDGYIIFGKHKYIVPKNITSIGAHQVANYAGVLILLETLGLLNEQYASAMSDFSLAGRLQRIEEKPDVIVDVAHNEASALALANYLQTQSKKYDNIYAVIGMLSDKDHGAILSAFNDTFEAVYCGRTEGERGICDKALTELSQSILRCPAKACGSLTQALECAHKQASSNDLIIAFGSFLVVEALT